MTGIREDKVVRVTVEKKDYAVKLKETQHVGIVYGGDVKDGKLPAGGSLAFSITPEEGWLVQSVQVNGRELPVTGKDVKENHYYTENGQAEIEVVLMMKGNGKITGFANQMVRILIAVGALAVLLGGIAVSFVVIKRKRGDIKRGQEEKEKTL